jgi:hypothetical protein
MITNDKQMIHMVLGIKEYFGIGKSHELNDLMNHDPIEWCPL